MNVVVIGLGSMGKRRIRLLQKYDSDMKIIGIDCNVERRKQVEEQSQIVTHADIDSVCETDDISYAFIATSPLSHAEIINKCLKRNWHVFTEINLVDTLYKENMELAKAKDRILFLSSTFLYRREIEFIKKKVHGCHDKINYLYHTGQYLPDWHPWESYKDFFVGKKETNGCRELMAIEFPWIIDIFGKIEKLTVTSSKISGLEINCADNYMLIFEHEGGNKGAVALDVVSRKASRNLEVFGEGLYLTWDGTPKGLKCYDYVNRADTEISLYTDVDRNPNYCETIIEDAYYCEIVNFFHVINGEETAKYSFIKDVEVLNLIEQIEVG